jgi:hypothetical protein
MENKEIKNIYKDYTDKELAKEFGYSISNISHHRRKHEKGERNMYSVFCEAFAWRDIANRIQDTVRVVSVAKFDEGEG